MAPAAVRIALSAFAFCAAFASASPRFPDQARIRSDYHDGDFDKVIKTLEAFVKSGRACTSAESLFLEKNLAVVYAANPSTRELGRYHMFRMLDLAPDADLLDMFVGEEVDAVFEKVRKEHSLHTASAKAPAPPVPAAASAPASGKSRAPVAAPAAMAKAAWEIEPAPAKASPRPAAAAKPRAAAVPSRASKAAWDDFAAAPVSIPASRSLPKAAAPGSRPASGSAGADAADSAPASPAAGPAGTGPNAAAFRSGGQPAWKEPGLWIGGGAALAVVALTFFYSNSSDDAPPGKTYVVPAAAAR